MPAQIRLKRVGRKKQPSFRIVVADSSTAVSGPAIEEIGLYQPRTDPTFVRLDAERTLHWLHSGAMPTDTVKSILRKAGLWQKFHEGLRPGQLPEDAREIVMGPAEDRMGTSARTAAASAASSAPSGEEAATAEDEPAGETEEEPRPEAAESSTGDAGAGEDTHEESADEADEADEEAGEKDPE